MKNNKNFVAKLAGVTMLATSALGAAAPVAGVVGVWSCWSWCGFICSRS